MFESAQRERFPHRPRHVIVALALAGIAFLAIVIVTKAREDHPELALDGVLWGLGFTVALLGACGIVSWVLHDRQVKHYDPNSTPVDERIERGRERALSWEEFKERYPNDVE
jgi:hypothetical protein